MSKLKKVLLMCTAYALVAALAIGGTVAYLQDDDSSVNVMTLGNVSIEQHEYERVVNADGTYATATIDNVTSYVLQDFTQAKPLLPIVGDPSEPGTSAAYAGYDDTIVRMTQVDSYGYMQVFAGKNAQDKFVTVENTGKTDAYVRTLVAIEVGSTDGSLVESSYHMCWDVEYIGVVTIDNNGYMIYECVYSDGNNSGARHQDGVLTAGETTYPSLSQVYLKHTATNEDMVAIDGNGNGALDILVLSQAVQAAGFENAQTALDTAFGKSAENAAEWFDGIADYQFVGAETAKYTLEGEAAAEVLASLIAGEDLIVDPNMDEIVFDTNEVDAQGATVTMNGQGPEAYGYLSFTPDAGENVTLSNLNVTGSGFVEVGAYGQGYGTYELTNVNITDFASTMKNGDKGFNLACAFMHFGHATLNNCVMTGTTAIQDGAMPVDLACANSFTTVVNGGKYGTVYCWSNGWTTINGADVDTMYVAPIKGTVTIKAGSHVGTLNIDYGIYAEKYADGSKLSQLVIEDGATVEKIVFNGTTYTLTEWNAR